MGHGFTKLSADPLEFLFVLIRVDLRQPAAQLVDPRDQGLALLPRRVLTVPIERRRQGRIIPVRDRRLLLLERRLRPHVGTHRTLRLGMLKGLIPGRRRLRPRRLLPRHRRRPSGCPSTQSDHYGTLVRSTQAASLTTRRVTLPGDPRGFSGAVAARSPREFL